MTTTPRPGPRRRTFVIGIALAFIFGGLIMFGIAALLVSINNRQVEARAYPAEIQPIADNELDPAVWGRNFPNEYDSFMRTQDSTIQTTYGGSVPYSKLAKYPVLTKLWAGYAFSVDYNKSRGHY